MSFVVLRRRAAQPAATARPLAAASSAARTPLDDEPPGDKPLGAAAAPGRRPALDWRIRFGVLALIWGFSFLFIKVGTQAY
ncbi:EamA/RhaT family transporter, partial [Streptomyces chryseus]